MVHIDEKKEFYTGDENALELGGYKEDRKMTGSTGRYRYDRVCQRHRAFGGR
jgi:hypothetical protein